MKQRKQQKKKRKKKKRKRQQTYEPIKEKGPFWTFERKIRMGAFLVCLGIFLHITWQDLLALASLSFGEPQTGLVMETKTTRSIGKTSSIHYWLTLRYPTSGQQTQGTEIEVPKHFYDQIEAKRAMTKPIIAAKRAFKIMVKVPIKCLPSAPSICAWSKTKTDGLWFLIMLAGGGLLFFYVSIWRASSE